MVSPPEISAEQ